MGMHCRYPICINTCDIQRVFIIISNFLTPSYILLSLVAAASRCNRILKDLASHGKTSTNNLMLDSTDKARKPTAINKYWISKRCFVHFYLVGLLSLAIATICHFDCHQRHAQYQEVDSEPDTSIVSRKIAVILLTIHLARRSYECIYIQQHRKESSKMQFAGYLLGLWHYTVLPLVFWDIDAMYNTLVPDSNIGIEDEQCLAQKTSYPATKITTTMKLFFLLMIIINIWLQFEQHLHHTILADIRRAALVTKTINTDTQEQDNHNLRQCYSLPPHRRWFRYVLCPHYLAEILIYLSFAIILESAAATTVQNHLLCKSMNGNNFEYFFSFERMISSFLMGRRRRHWSLFIWVLTNLTISAMNNRDWYNLRYRNDTDHSRDKRKALFPMVL